MSLKKVRNVLDLTCCLCTKRFFEGVVRVLGLRFALTYKHPLWVFTLLDRTWVLSLQAILLTTENLPQNLPQNLRFKKYLAKWRKFTTKEKKVTNYRITQDGKQGAFRCTFLPLPSRNCTCVGSTNYKPIYRVLVVPLSSHFCVFHVGSTISLSTPVMSQFFFL